MMTTVHPSIGHPTKNKNQRSALPVVEFPSLLQCSCPLRCSALQVYRICCYNTLARRNHKGAPDLFSGSHVKYSSSSSQLLLLLLLIHHHRLSNLPLTRAVIKSCQPAASRMWFREHYLLKLIVVSFRCGVPASQKESPQINPDSALYHNAFSLNSMFWLRAKQQTRILTIFTLAKNNNTFLWFHSLW